MSDQETATEPKPVRSFVWVRKPRTKSETEVRRTITLTADLGCFRALKKHPEQPIDFLTDAGACEKVALDKFLQGRLIYALSDAQDLDEDEFFRGLTAGAVGQAVAALRGALLDFFLEQELPDHAQTLATAFQTNLAVRAHMAQTVRETDVGGQVVKALIAEDVQAALNRAISEGMKGIGDTIRTTPIPGN